MPDSREEDIFETLIFDQLIDANTRGIVFKVSGKVYTIPFSMINVINIPDTSVEIRKWYYDKHFI